MPTMPLNADSFDAILDKVDVALYRVNASQGSIVRLPAEELDLLKYLESARDFMLSVVSDVNDRTLLRIIFGGDCERITRIRLSLEACKLSQMNADDQRVRSCFNACESVEKVLRDLGFSTQLQDAHRKETGSEEKSASLLETIVDVGGTAADVTLTAASEAAKAPITAVRATITAAAAAANIIETDAHPLNASNGKLIQEPVQLDAQDKITTKVLSVGAEDVVTAAATRHYSSQPRQGAFRNGGYSRPQVKETWKSVGFDIAGHAVARAREATTAAASGIRGTAVSAVALQDHVVPIFDDKLVLPIRKFTHELRVEIVSASDLGVPEYRVGDLTATLLGGARDRLEAVYAELDIQGVRKRTTTGVTDSVRRSVRFASERHLLPFAGEPNLIVRVRDKRHMQAMLRGDPLIGEGSLRIAPEILDGMPRPTQIQLKRAGVPVGVIALRYQVLDCMPQIDGAVEPKMEHLQSAEEGFDLGVNFQLGAGSWAAAYRRAEGNRRMALRLLFCSGIVTKLELTDDLTEISEEHIDECVLIADAMLNSSTFDAWVRSPTEAKAFFEERLTELYQQKFGV